MERAAAALRNTMGDAFEGDSHALLMAIYKDPRQPVSLRLDAAKAAIGYEKPRLQSVESNMNVKMSHEDMLELLKARADGRPDGRLGN